MPAPFHQIVAIIYVLRRLVICTSVAPLLMIGVPIALRLLYTILSLCVGGDDRSIFLAAVLTAVLSGLAVYFHPLIDFISSETAKANATKSKSKELQRSDETKKDSAMESSKAATPEKSALSLGRMGTPFHRIQLFLAVFVLSIVMVRSWEQSFLLRVVRNLLPNRAFLLQLPTFLTSLRLSFSMLVLGCMVAARFFGPTSIGTFSMIPGRKSIRGSLSVSTFSDRDSSVFHLSVDLQPMGYYATTLFSKFVAKPPP
jgi:hypothetical protein